MNFSNPLKKTLVELAQSQPETQPQALVAHGRGRTGPLPALPNGRQGTNEVVYEVEELFYADIRRVVVE